MPARPRNNRTPDGAKKRWTDDDRAKRGGASGGRRGAEDPGARRPDWSPGPRVNPRDRFARPESDRRDGDRRPSRGADRGERTPFRGDDRGERRPYQGGGDRRPSTGDRSERAPFRGDDRGDRRPARGDDRGERRPYQGDDRRPRTDDREERRPSQGGRDERRPSFRDADRGDRRPLSDDRRPPRSDDRRPSFRSDDRRPARDDRRPDRSEDRGRRFGFDERPARYEAPEDVVLERLDAKVVTAAEVDGSSFADLGLGERITDALAELGATAPFPIQAATIPVALAGRNVLGRGRTGSGKTIAFGAALVERLLRNWAESGRSGSGRRTGRPPRALILAPTRELALQIDRTVQPISRAVGLYTTQIVGGVPQARQVGALSKGVDIVIGTPGRIEDLLEQGRLDLSQVEITVLDEADHMAELGFLEPMRRLLARVPAKGQRMLFSATLDSAVAALVEEFLPNPAVHEVADDEGGGTADHRVLVIDPTDKLQVLVDLIGSVDRALVFARTRAFAEQLADELDGAGVRAESLHGDLNQARRTRNLARFSDGQVKALVATDVAARGIHVDAIDLVVHADMAEEYKAYLHRSGRTGRAGASGTVVTLIGARRRRKMTELLDRAGIEAEFVVLQRGDDPAAKIGR